MVPVVTSIWLSMLSSVSCVSRVWLLRSQASTTSGAPCFCVCIISARFFSARLNTTSTGWGWVITTSPLVSPLVI
ncbi:hypothetical protein EIO60_00882|nr:hypothetical protein [Candidatus Pantoea persica]